MLIKSLEDLMKKISILFLIVIFSLIFGCSTEIVRTFISKEFTFVGKKRVALLNVCVKTARDSEVIRRNIIAEVEIQLKQHSFIVSSQDDLKKILAELNLPVDREYSSDEIIKVQKKLNVVIIAQGFVSELAPNVASDEKNIVVNFKYYDGTNSRYVAESLYQFNGEENVLNSELMKKAISYILTPFGIKN